ncbi:unnamed protein product [Candidula unifasciata]|uniref:Uncharacterized protein n=1 Tax=Candidula unifasciata TaxID=100452 RepID=A0A8S3ZUE3_9EUPU|nr:unnamed protein product [Candidula unifasciata]
MQTIDLMSKPSITSVHTRSILLLYVYIIIKKADTQPHTRAQKRVWKVGEGEMGERKQRQADRQTDGRKDGRWMYGWMHGFPDISPY